MSDLPQIRLDVSQPRRWFGIALLYGLGALLLYLALGTTPAMAWRVAVLGMAALALWLGEKMRRATAGGVEMTGDALVDHDGTVIVRLDDIRSVERGMLAFKPSSGFLLTTHARGSRRWKPGVWWRLGRYVGIGGVTSGAQSKMMADLLQARLMGISGKG